MGTSENFKLYFVGNPKRVLKKRPPTEEEEFKELDDKFGKIDPYEYYDENEKYKTWDEEDAEEEEEKRKKAEEDKKKAEEEKLNPPPPKPEPPKEVNILPKTLHKEEEYFV